MILYFTAFTVHTKKASFSILFLSVITGLQKLVRSLCDTSPQNQFVKIFRIFWNEKHTSYINCCYHCFHKTKTVFLNYLMLWVFFKSLRNTVLLPWLSTKIRFISLCFLFWNAVVFFKVSSGKNGKGGKKARKQCKAKEFVWYSIYSLVLIQISIGSVLFRKYFLDSLAWGITF